MILIVEDHDDCRELLRRVLQLSGYASSAASDGDSAIEQLTAAAAAGRLPALVLLEFNMPRVSGLQVLKCIRDTPSLAGLPVIMYTAVGGDSVRTAAEWLGVQGYILKGEHGWPYLFDQLQPFLGPPHRILPGRNPP